MATVLTANTVNTSFPHRSRLRLIPNRRPFSKLTVKLFGIEEVDTYGFSRNPIESDSKISFRDTLAWKMRWLTSKRSNATPLISTVGA